MKSITAVRIFKVLALILVVSFCLGSGAALAEGKGDEIGPININTATVKEIMKLPGIGKKKAEAIVAYRQDNGRFADIDDLKKVEGVGKKTYEKIKEHLVVE